MSSSELNLVDYYSEEVNVDGEEVFWRGKLVKSRNSILRFSPDISYSSGNFERLRNEHATLQIDSKNGSTTRRDLILKRTGWPESFFRGKVILECGCGAGADTDALLSLGARIISADLAGLDVVRKNIGENSNSILLQADICDLPLKESSFDIVWCHRVLQHTPNPEMTLSKILRYVKSDGAVFVHSYSKTARQMLSWKYFFRPFTKRMNPEKLYYLVRGYVPTLYRATNFLRRIPPNILGKILFKASQQILPIRNYRFEEAFARFDDEYLIEYAVHDTFDALSPKYDWPLSVRTIREIAEPLVQGKFEVVETAGVTLLRSKLPQ